MSLDLIFNLPPGYVFDDASMSGGDTPEPSFSNVPPAISFSEGDEGVPQADTTLAYDGDETLVFTFRGVDVWLTLRGGQSSGATIGNNGTETVTITGTKAQIEDELLASECYLSIATGETEADESIEFGIKRQGEVVDSDLEEIEVTVTPLEPSFDLSSPTQNAIEGADSDIDNVTAITYAGAAPNLVALLEWSGDSSIVFGFHDSTGCTIGNTLPGLCTITGPRAAVEACIATLFVNASVVQDGTLDISLYRESVYQIDGTPGELDGVNITVMPIAPTGFTVQAGAIDPNTTLDLQWTNRPGNYDSFLLSWGVGPGDQPNPIVGVVGAQTSYTDSGFEPGEGAYYKLMGVKNGIQSAPVFANGVTDPL